MSAAEKRDKWLSEIGLDTVFKLFKDNGATEILYKVLPQNANSKNQVYLAPDLSLLGKIPSGEVTLHESTSQKSGGVIAVFRSALDFYWVRQDGRACKAPDAKLIFYPQYPEVRFSGFLRGCTDSPSSLYDKALRGREPGRILVLGVGAGTKTLGITLPPECPAAKEIESHRPQNRYGVFISLAIPGEERGDGYLDLMQRLCAIHHQEWVSSQRLNKKGVLVACNASNCHGNTLESLLGIRSNGFSEPDFRGWEIKCRSVKDYTKPRASKVTLLTPEPTTGVYASDGFLPFMERFGYPDTKGRSNRTNFGGTYRANRPAHQRTKLRLVLDGYNAEDQSYVPSGAVRLLDRDDNEAMGWPFSKLVEHWKKKHAQAAFVPAQLRVSPGREYRYGRKILLGEGAVFGLFLAGIATGKIFYDPGIKLVQEPNESPETKRRSQFRIGSNDIPSVYASCRLVDACTEAGCS